MLIVSRISSERKSNQSLIEFVEIMLMKCRNGIFSGNLFSRQRLALSASRNALNQSLSTSKLSANQYDDLYADRWAKFQCELIALDFILFFEARIDFLRTHRSRCAAILSRVVLAAHFLLRESHTICIQTTSKHLFGFYLFFAAKKLPKSVNSKGVFAANELDLDEVSIYGFDYDYT